MNIPDFSGKTLGGRYRLSRRIGYGGMATVYAATDQQIDKPVAVKVLNPNFSHIEDYIARFRQEALSAARIPHPNLVDVTDFGSDEGLAYFVMEMLSGESLSDRLHRLPGPMRWQEVVAIITQVCEALAHAHDHGVIHRDVKPGNVFLVAQPGRAVVLAKLLDLGIAKVMRDVLDLRGSAPDTRLSQGTPGTPEYMSPEQAMGWEVDHRADLYALGVTMYRMLTGYLPFYSPNSVFEVQRMHVELPPVSLRQLAPAAQIPVGVENVVLKALAKRADERFASARELAEALLAAQDAELGRDFGDADDRTTHYVRSAPPQPAFARRLLTVSTAFAGMTMSAAFFVLLMLTDIPYVREFALQLRGQPSRPAGELEIHTIIDEAAPEEVVRAPVREESAPVEKREAPTVPAPPAETETPEAPAESGTPVEPPSGQGGGAPEPEIPPEWEWDNLDTQEPPETRRPPVKPTRPAAPGAPPELPPSTSPNTKSDPRAAADQFISRALGKIARKCNEGRPTVVSVEVTIESGRVQAKLLSLANSRSECVVKELQLLKPPKSLGPAPVRVTKKVSV